MSAGRRFRREDGVRRFISRVKSEEEMGGGGVVGGRLWVFFRK